MKEAKLQSSGLWINANPISIAHPGAMSNANNIITSNGSIYPRPGNNNVISNGNFNSDTSGSVIKSMAFRQLNIVASYFSQVNAATQIITNVGTSSGSWEPIQSNNHDLTASSNPNDIPGASGSRFGMPYNPPVHYAESGKNFYLTTYQGIVRLNDFSQVSGTYSTPGSGKYRNWPLWAGAPRGGTCKPALNNSVSGFLPSDSSCAYSVLWCIKDSFGRIIQGYPGGREVIRHMPVNIQTGSPTTGYSGSASRPASSAIVTVTANANGGWPSFPYANGQTVTITYKSNEIAGFTTGSYVISGVTSTSFQYTDPSANTGALRTSTLPIAVVGPALSVSLTVAIPQAVTSDGTLAPIHFFQIYRSELTSSALIEPTDDKRLVFEGYLAAGDLVAPWTKTVVDSSSPAFSGQYIYTAPAVGGADQGNVPPPMGVDICDFQGSLFVANTSLRGACKINILKAGSIQLTIDTKTFTSAGFSSVSVADSIALNAKDLVAKINAERNFSGSAPDVSKAITAWYGGVPDDPSTIGLIYLESTYHNRAQFEVFSTTGHTDFQPPLRTGSGDTAVPGVQSDVDQRKNRVYYSNPQEPESFPAANYIDIGQATSPIYRVMATQNSLFIFKTEGIYRITGSDGEFLVEPFDLTKYILGGESVAKLGGSVYCLCSQGVARVDDTGVKIVSDAIKMMLDTDQVTGAYGSVCFAANAELFGLYILSYQQFGVPSVNAFLSKQYVYNHKDDNWTTWSILAQTAFCSDSFGNFYIGRSELFNNTVRVLRQDAPGVPSTGDFIAQNVSVGVLTSASWHPIGDQSSGIKHFRRIKLLYSLPYGISTVSNSVLSINFSTGINGNTFSSSDIFVQINPVTSSQNQSQNMYSLIIDIPKSVNRGTFLTVNMSTNINVGAYIQWLGFVIYMNESEERTGNRNG
jgi:hypothetical protein